MMRFDGSILMRFNGTLVPERLCEMRLILISLVMLLSGCATGPSYPPISISTDVIRAPAVGQVSRTRLGDSLLEYARSSTYPALRIDDFHRYTFCLFTIEVDAQKAPAKFLHPEEGKLFQASIFINAAKNPNSRAPSSTWIYKAYQDDSSGYFIKSPTGCGADKAVVQKIEEIQAIDVESPSFKQELVYNGRVSDNLKIIYREYSNNMARGAFSQEAQYDLSKSDIIAFKGARLRILDATNEAIEYEVLSHFEQISFD